MAERRHLLECTKNYFNVIALHSPCASRPSVRAQVADDIFSSSFELLLYSSNDFGSSFDLLVFCFVCVVFRLSHVDFVYPYFLFDVLICHV